MRRRQPLDAHYERGIAWRGDNAHPDSVAGCPRGTAASCAGPRDRGCRRAQDTEFTVLCPARLPRATRAITPGPRPAPLVVHGGSDVLDFSYSAAASPEGRCPCGSTRPSGSCTSSSVARFSASRPGARPARLGGRRGLLARATPNGSFGSVPSFDNHVRFVWREHGTRYVATLHTFGERATERLLG
jgi:hypothetical protein